MNLTRWKIVSIIGIVFLLNACSSSQTKEGDEAEVIPPASDAGTDAVPQPSAETGDAGSALTPPPAPSADATSGIPPANSTSPSIQPPTTPSTLEATPSIPPSNSMSTATNTSSSETTVGSGQFEDYTVQQGDTLMKIAFEVYGDLYKWRSIYEANKDKITNPNAVPKGLVLKVEKPASPVTIDRTGEKYLIKTGDTLGKISGTVYGTPSKWREIWEHNKQLIRNPNKIFAGFYLYYTASSDASSASKPSSEASSSTGSSSLGLSMPSSVAPAAPANGGK